jgi:hypothetical protein
MMYVMNICMRIPLIDIIIKLIKKLEQMDLFISINVLKIEQLKILIYLQDDIDIFLKELIILITQKLIKNLCETVKVVTLRDKCSNCDE